MLIDKLIGMFGNENCLIIIGSSTSFNKRTPFTYAARKKMIKILYPEIKIVGLPDTNPDNERYNPEKMNIWIGMVKKLERASQSKFAFYSGSDGDIEYLKGSFPVRILVNRLKEGKRISASAIRNSLEKGKKKEIAKLIDAKILDIAVEQFHRF